MVYLLFQIMRREKEQKYKLEVSCFLIKKIIRLFAVVMTSLTDNKCALSLMLT